VEPPSAQRQAAQQVISAKDREKNRQTKMVTRHGYKYLLIAVVPAGFCLVVSPVGAAGQSEDVTNQRPPAERDPGPFEGPASYPQLCWWSLICAYSIWVVAELM
jgi:hypothetical protein